MARNKLASQARVCYVTRRERTSLGAEEIWTTMAAPGQSPSDLAAWKDLLVEVRQRLTAAVRRLADKRAERREWTEIAAEVGGNPEALRKQLARALDRVSHQLGLDEWRHG